MYVQWQYANVQSSDRSPARAQEVEIASEIQWPTQRDRVVAAARGIFRGQPEGLPTWGGYRRTVRFDVAFEPEWMHAAYG